MYLLDSEFPVLYMYWLIFHNNAIFSLIFKNEETGTDSWINNLVAQSASDRIRIKPQQLGLKPSSSTLWLDNLGQVP